MWVENWSSDRWPMVREVGRAEVARCNTIVAVPGRRFIYAHTRRFEWLDPETNRVRPSEEILELAKRLRGKEAELIEADAARSSGFVDDAMRRSRPKE